MEMAPLDLAPSSKISVGELEAKANSNSAKALNPCPPLFPICAKIFFGKFSEIFQGCLADGLCGLGHLRLQNGPQDLQSCAVR